MRTIDGNDLMNELEDFDADENSRTERLRTGQAALFFAIGVFRDVASEAGDDHAKAYLVDHLEILASQDHGFLSRDFNVDDWIEQIENGDDD